MIAPNIAAPQHEPRPLPLFLAMLLQQSNGDAGFITEVLAGVRAYRDAERRARPAPMPVVATIGRARVLDYGGSGAPALFVPSLINPPHVLDLDGDKSMLRWMSGQDIRPLMLDWGTPDVGDAGLSMAGHVEEILVPLIATLGEDMPLVGYCLGGTLAIAAAQLTRAKGLALIATPWRFSGYPDESRAHMRPLWDSIAPATEQLGVFPMEMLQSMFWQLDPQRTLSKYAEFGKLDPNSDLARSFVTLEDWANEGPPLTLAAARDLLLDFHGDDAPGQGLWKVGGEPIDLEVIDCPVLDIVSSIDRIVPAATSTGLGKRLTLNHGHVGMVVGRHARNGLWTALAGWLSQVRHS